eukprot:scaffold11629_cov63-Phaeocystis_antarctica.AAC.12
MPRGSRAPLGCVLGVWSDPGPEESTREGWAASSRSSRPSAPASHRPPPPSPMAAVVPPCCAAEAAALQLYAWPAPRYQPGGAKVRGAFGKIGPGTHALSSAYCPERAYCPKRAAQGLGYAQQAGRRQQKAPCGGEHVNTRYEPSSMAALGRRHCAT